MYKRMFPHRTDFFLLYGPRPYDSPANFVKDDHHIILYTINHRGLFKNDKLNIQQWK